MKRTWFIISSLVIVLLLLAALPAQSSAFAQQAGTPTRTLEPEIEETLPPPPISESTITPTPTFVPTLAPTAIPVVPKTGLPVVVPLLESSIPDDGFGPQEYPFYINPLTGLIVTDQSIFNRRPIAIKVTNHPRYVRPQNGLSKADVVFEYYMEQGISRFIAVFYGQDAEKVGPVRSGRLFDEHIFRMFSSYFVFGYADVHVLEYFENIEREFPNRFVLENDIDHVRHCGVDLPGRLCRDPELEGYNTMFANTEEVHRYFRENYGGDDRQDLSGLYFSNHVIPSIDPATTIKLRYSPTIYNYWGFDHKSGLYLRWQETQGSMDLTVETYARHYDDLTNEQLSASNVVFLVIDHKFLAYTPGTEIVGFNFHGRGQAYVFRDGFGYPAEWERPGDGGVLRLYTLDGEPFPLKPGQTWFEVVSQYTNMERSGQTWKFDFALPPVELGSVYVMDPNATSLEWFWDFQNPGKSRPWNGVILSPTPTVTNTPIVTFTSVPTATQIPTSTPTGTPTPEPAGD